MSVPSSLYKILRLAVLQPLTACIICRSVSMRQLEDVELCKGPMIAAVASLSVEIHASVVAAADQFYQELRRR